LGKFSINKNFADKDLNYEFSRSKQWLLPQDEMPKLAKILISAKHMFIHNRLKSLESYFFLFWSNLPIQNYASKLIAGTPRR
jgi:hypothetical protein